MKNEEISKMYAIPAELLLEEDEAFDDNWLVSGSDLFKDFDESEIELGI